MPTIDDYLTKQIYIDKNVVTFRSLSRQFGVHVNAAKNELATFHSNSVTPDTRSFATYLISGEPFPQPRVKLISSTQTTEDSMDVDSGLAATGDEEDDQEDVPITTMTLVGENDLEDAKAKYARIFSVHVYCLSPSPLNDAGHICDPSVVVYKADAVDAPASSIALGRIVGPDARIGKVPPPIASSSKAPEPISRKPTVKAPSEDVKPTDNGKQKSDTPKPKATGKLDWSKAKKTPETGKKIIKVKREESPVRKVKETTPTTKSESESPVDNGKRGVKRKAALPPASDTEEKPKAKEEKKAKEGKPKPEPVNDIKLRKNRIVSDDEDEDDAPAPKPKGKGKSRASAIADALQSAEERSLRAMMDMDDDEVENASKGCPRPNPAQSSSPAIPSDEDIEMAASEPEPVPPSEPEQDDNEDVDMEEDIPQPKKPQARKKKAPKEPVPIGRNGLKKKLVKHTVVTTDAKGYMQSTDVFEYESVDEEEAAEEAAKEAKKPAKGKKTSAAKPKKDDDEAKESAPKPLKPVARSNSVKKSAGAKPKPSAQGSLKDFFGKPKK